MWKLLVILVIKNFSFSWRGAPQKRVFRCKLFYHTFFSVPVARGLEEYLWGVHFWLKWSLRQISLKDSGIHVL